MTGALQKLTIVGAAAWLAGAQMPAGHADEHEAEPETLRCLNARTIRRTHVINDDYVVFWIQGRRLFLNALPKSCKGLSRDRRFSFETSTRSLCVRDKIRVLEESASGFYEGRFCTLGLFYPMSEEDLASFIQDRTVTPQPEEVESADVEDIVKEQP